MKDREKQEALQNITELIRMQEEAIENHPPPALEVYERGRAALVEGAEEEMATEWVDEYSLSIDELSTIHRYLISSSFISAWYHLSGDKAQRDKAAHSCSTLVGGVGGPSSLEAMSRHQQYEQLWREMMKTAGVQTGGSSNLGLILIIVAIVIVLGFVTMC